MQCIYYTYIDFLAAEVISYEQVEFPLMWQIYRPPQINMNSRLVPFHNFSWSVVVST